MDIITLAMAKNYVNDLLRLIGHDPRVFGVSWDKSSSPLLTRTDDSVGMIANAGVDDQVVQNDFDYAPIFGDIHEVKDALGNVFVRIPKLYIGKTDGLGFKTWQVSKVRYPGFYLPWCFWDFERGVELPYIDVGKYKASLGSGNRLESKPGTRLLVSTNIVNFRTYAQNNNADGLRGYQLLDIHAYDVLQTLMYIEFATLDLQSVMRGFVSGAYSEDHKAVMAEAGTNRIVVTNSVASNFRVGQSIGIGTARGSFAVTGGGRVVETINDLGDGNSEIVFDGEPVSVAEDNVIWSCGWINGFSSAIAASSGYIGANDGKFPCSYRGIESPYGDIFQWVDGVNINDHQAWVCKDANQYASNQFAGTAYEKLGYVNADTSGYFKEIGFDPDYPFAGLPVEVGGSSSTYYSDYYYQNTGQRVARVGGYWYVGLTAGPSCWALNTSASTSHVYIGGRLLKKAL